MQTRGDDLRIIEDHEGAGRKLGWKITENAVRNRAVTINEQFRRITLGQGILRNPPVGEGIRIIFNSDYRYHRIKFSRHKITLSGREKEMFNL